MATNNGGSFSDFIKSFRAIKKAFESNNNEATGQTDYSDRVQVKVPSTAFLPETKFTGSREYTNVANPLYDVRTSQGNRSIEDIAPEVEVKTEEKEDGFSDRLAVPGTAVYDNRTGDTYYTYKKGDTFGQVIKDLALDTENGLWGNNGDVAYYTRQLREQGIPGMIPIGTTIRLRKRK